MLHGRLLHVSTFLSQHAGGELAVFDSCSEDAVAELNMIHPPNVVEKYLPDAIFGVLGSGGAAKSSLPVAIDQGYVVANLEACGD